MPHASRAGPASHASLARPHASSCPSSCPACSGDAAGALGGALLPAAAGGRGRCAAPVALPARPPQPLHRLQVRVRLAVADMWMRSVACLVADKHNCKRWHLHTLPRLPVMHTLYRCIVQAMPPLPPSPSQAPGHHTALPVHLLAPAARLPHVPRLQGGRGAAVFTVVSRHVGTMRGGHAGAHEAIP